MKHHYCSSSFWQGVRRISALLVCMLFTSVFVVSPIKVKAEAFPIPPVWLPMNPYNAQGLKSNYVLLNDDQKEIVKEIIGAVNIVNLGFGQYVLMNPISGVQNTREFLREYGGTFLETFWTQIMGTSRAMTDFVGSTIYKASTYNTLEEYEEETSPNVASGSQKYFQISPELTVAFKNWYRANGGVENWQQYANNWDTDTGITWVGPSATGLALDNYNNTVSQYIPNYHVLAYGANSLDYYGNVWNGSIGSYDVFINTSLHYIGFVDSNGNYNLSFDGYLINQYNYGSKNTYVNSKSATFNRVTYNPNNFNSLVEVAQYYLKYYPGILLYLNRIQGDYTNTWGFISAENYFSGHVYAGSSWAEKEEVYNIDDLNIGSTPSEYIDNITDTGYVDINTLIGQIADEVVNLREVVEESVLVKDNTDAVPYAESLTKAIDKYLSEPESQVVIPVDIFSGLTGPSGPISYLWFMTKPLVSYTGDMLSLLTYDSDGQFQFSGLGYIVVGIVSIGIIGGLVTKCLL